LTSLPGKDFFFSYGGRKFQLRAETDEEKEIWINALITLMNYNKEMSPGLKNSMNPFLFSLTFRGSSFKELEKVECRNGRIRTN